MQPVGRPCLSPCEWMVFSVAWFVCCLCRLVLSGVMGTAVWSRCGRKVVNPYVVMTKLVDDLLVHVDGRSGRAGCYDAASLADA